MARAMGAPPRWQGSPLELRRRARGRINEDGGASAVDNIEDGLTSIPRPAAQSVDRRPRRALQALRPEGEQQLADLVDGRIAALAR